MNLPEFSVKRRVTVIMMTAAVVLLGAVSLSKLKIDLFPDITFPVVAVSTVYPGVGPEEVETFVTRPIEEAVGIVKHLKSISSISQEGRSSVIVEFDWGTDMDFAAVDVREKVDMVTDNLPDDCRRPLIIKADVSVMIPTLSLAATGSQSLQDLRKLCDDVIKRDLEKAEGVASVTVMGGLEREILVEVDKGRLEAYGISVQQIEQALKTENLNIPGGRLDQGQMEFAVRTVGEFKTVDEIGEIAIGWGSPPVRLKDVAQVKDTTKEQRSYARLNGADCVALTVQKQSVANTVEVSKAVKQAIPEIEKNLPEGTKLIVTWDQADYIESSIRNMKSVAVEGAILAVVIIFLFLTTIRSTVAIGLSIPISLVATFVLMYFSGMTLNVITLGGLTLGIGRIVDDSIIVLENIHRHLERGLGQLRSRSWRPGMSFNSLIPCSPSLLRVARSSPLIFTSIGAAPDPGPMASVILKVAPGIWANCWRSSS